MTQDLIGAGFRKADMTRQQCKHPNQALVWEGARDTSYTTDHSLSSKSALMRPLTKSAIQTIRGRGAAPVARRWGALKGSGPRSGVESDVLARSERDFSHSEGTHIMTNPTFRYRTAPASLSSHGAPNQIYNTSNSLRSANTSVALSSISLSIPEVREQPTSEWDSSVNPPQRVISNVDERDRGDSTKSASTNSSSRTVGRPTTFSLKKELFDSAFKKARDEINSARTAPSSVGTNASSAGTNLSWQSINSRTSKSASKSSLNRQDTGISTASKEAVEIKFDEAFDDTETSLPGSKHRSSMSCVINLE